MNAAARVPARLAGGTLPSVARVDTSGAEQADPTGLASRESFSALLFRRISLEYYLRSPCYARHLARVGRGETLPVPPFVDVLAEYLSRALPAWAVAGLGERGLFKLARLVTVLLRPAAGALRGLAFLIEAGWEVVRRGLGGAPADPGQLDTPGQGPELATGDLPSAAPATGAADAGA